jgi:hypothetical protein
MSQIATSDDQYALHRKRESAALFNQDLILEDALITEDGVIENPFEHLKAEFGMKTEDYEKLVATNHKLQQEFDRKFLKPRNVSLEEKHYRFVGDNNVKDEEFANLFRFPRTEPFKRITGGELYRVPKDKVHDELVERSKAYLSELFKPYDLREENLIKIAERLRDENSDKEELINELIKIIPKLNYNLVANLAMHLAFDAKINDHTLWKTIQECVMREITLYSFHDLCKLQYATCYLSPKRTDAVFDEAIWERVSHDMEKASSYDMMLAMQCFRYKGNYRFYDKCVEVMINNKDRYLSETAENDDQAQSHLVINLLYSYASNKPKPGFFKIDATAKKVDELLTHYEYELMDLIQF